MKQHFIKGKLLSVLLAGGVSVSAQNATFYLGLGDQGIDKANMVVLAPDGTILLAGTTSKGTSMPGNACITRLDPLGQMKWTKAYGSLADDESLNDVKITADKGLVAVGERYLPTTTGGKKSEMGVLLKTDSLGNLAWWKEFDHNGNEAEGFSIQQSSDQGFITAGMMKDLQQLPDPFFSIRGGSKRLYVLKTDQAGVSQWAGYLGGDYGSKALFIRQTRDNGYILTGHIYASTNEDQDTRIFLLKLDAGGKLQWLKMYNSEGKGEEVGMSVFEMQDNGFIVCGTTTDAGAGQEDIFLLRTDKNGAIVWSKVYGGSKSDMAKSMKPLPGGGYLIGGTSNSFGSGSYEPFMLRTDDQGNVLWCRTYGNRLYTMALAVDASRNACFVSGFYINATGNVDAFCLKTNGAGEGECSKPAAIKTGTYAPEVTPLNGASWMVSASSQLTRLANGNAAGAASPVYTLQPACPAAAKQSDTH